MSSTSPTSGHSPRINTLLNNEDSSKRPILPNWKNQTMPLSLPLPSFPVYQNTNSTELMQSIERSTPIPLPSLSQLQEKREISWSASPESHFERPNNATKSIPSSSIHLPSSSPTPHPRSFRSMSTMHTPTKYHKWTEERRIVLLRIMYENRSSFGIKKSGTWWNMVNSQYNQIEKAEITGNQNAVIKGWLNVRKEHRLAHPSGENKPKSSYESVLDMWQDTLNEYQLQEDRKREIQGQADRETQGSLNWRESVKNSRSQKRKYAIQEGEWLEDEQEGYVNPQSQENPLTVITPIKRSKLSLQEKAYDAIVRIAENTQKGGKQGGVDEKVDKIEKKLVELEANINKKVDNMEAGMNMILEYIKNGRKNEDSNKS